MYVYGGLSCRDIFILFLLVILSLFSEVSAYKRQTGNEDALLSDQSYFLPYEKSYVGVYGDPSNYKRERINEGAFESSNKELIFDNATASQVCPGMVGPFTDGNYYCTAREYGYCDRRFGMCFCNMGYQGIDCSSCTPEYFKVGDQCYPKKLCPDDCSGAGECDYWSGKCKCFAHRIGENCGQLVCKKIIELCDSCATVGSGNNINVKCLRCKAGYYIDATGGCSSCYTFDPRCTGCTLETGCSVCSDPLLLSVRRSGYRASDRALPVEEATRELSIALPFGSQNPNAFGDVEVFKVVSTPNKPLNNRTVVCHQGLHMDERWDCSRKVASHIVCGHSGIFAFRFPNYVVNETSKYIRLSVSRSGGGYGNVSINYYIQHLTTDESDVTSTAPYTTAQTLVFSEGVVERTFLVSILDDNIPEENEVFQVVLEQPDGSGSLGAQFRTNITIVDDDINKLSPIFTHHKRTELRAVAGVPFFMNIEARLAQKQVMHTGGELFYSFVENNNDKWKEPGGATRTQRQAIRTVCNNTDVGNGTYTATCLLNEQGLFQLRTWHAFPGGLRGDYFFDSFFERLSLSRIDRHVNFTWGAGRILTYGSDYVSVRWTGLVRAPASGIYNFAVDTDDHARLWIDGDLIIDHWHMQNAYKEPPRFVHFEAHRLYEVVLEYRDVTNYATVRLMWKTPLDSPSKNVYVVPMEYLYSHHSIGNSPAEVEVFSADTEPRTTECYGQGLFTGTVHHESHFEFCPRDKFGNMRDDADTFFLGSEKFSSRFTLVSSPKEFDGQGAEEVIPTLSYDPESHCFRGRYTPLLAGRHRLDITYQKWYGETVVHVLGSPFYVTVSPNRMDGPNSRVYGFQKPTIMEAGACMNFTIVARDTSRNLLLHGGDNLQVYMYRAGFFANAAEQVVSTEPYDGDTAVTEARKGAIFDLGNGNYTGRICPITTGWHETHVQINGAGISNLPFRTEDYQRSLGATTGAGSFIGQYIHRSPYRLYVHHSVASPSYTTAQGPGLNHSTVGVPISFMVTVRDAWRNVVRNRNKPFNLTFSLEKSPGIVFSSANHNNGSYTITYTSVMSGDDLLAIYINHGHIEGSPFHVAVTDGVHDAQYSNAVGPGLIVGTTGITSFFELMAFDLGNNRKSNFDEVYVFETSGSEIIKGIMVPVGKMNPYEAALNAKYGTGGDYVATFVPTKIGLLTIRVYLNGTSSSSGRTEVSNSPFVARIHPSNPISKETDVSGPRFDVIAGVPYTVSLQLRDAFANKLDYGGADLEMVSLGVAGEWGTIQPWGTLPGVQDRYFYRGFNNRMYDDIYSQWEDHDNGKYTASYTIYTTGEYVVRLALADPGLNATYYNTTSFGYLVDFNDDPDAFTRSLEGAAVNTGTSISWTGDLMSNAYYHMYRSRVESDVSFDYTSPPANKSFGYKNETYSGFRIEEHFRYQYWSVRYTGLIVAPVDETFIFSIEMDQNSRALLRIGGRGLATNGSAPGDVVINVTTYQGTSTAPEYNNSYFEASRASDLRGSYKFTDTLYREFLFEYSHFEGPSKFTLYWESPSTPRQQVPASAFRHWRNISHYNMTVHSAPLCPHCSTAHGASLTSAIVGLPQSFVVYGRDAFSNLQQKGNEVVTAVGVSDRGATFRGVVTDYGNSTYLVEYYPTTAGTHLLYVTIGCCPLHPNVGISAEVDSMKDILISGAPFRLEVSPGKPNPSRSTVVGSGAIGSIAGEYASIHVLYRDVHNNPTKFSLKTPEQLNMTTSPLRFTGGLNVTFFILGVDVYGRDRRDHVVPDHLEYNAHEEKTVVTYNLRRSGKYEMIVEMFGEPVLGSPFKTTVNHAIADANTTRCKGIGLRNANAGDLSNFEIALFDKFSNPVEVGGNKFHLRVAGSGYNVDGTGWRSSLALAIPLCKDMQTGKYLCSYVAATPGAFEIRMLLLNSTRSHPGGDGLRGSYYSRTDGTLPGSPLTEEFNRVDSMLNFQWMDGLVFPVPNLSPSSLDANLFFSGFFVRWEGYIVAPTTDSFTISCDSIGFKSVVYIEDELVFDSDVGVLSPAISWVADIAFRIRVEISSIGPVNIGTPASFALMWQTASTLRRSAIPAFYLYSGAKEIIYSPFPLVVAA